MGTWSVVMSALCVAAPCYLLICMMTRGFVESRQSSLWLIVDYKPSLHYTILYYTILYYTIYYTILNYTILYYTNYTIIYYTILN